MLYLWNKNYIFGSAPIPDINEVADPNKATFYLPFNSSSLSICTKLNKQGSTLRLKRDFSCCCKTSMKYFQLNLSFSSFPRYVLFMAFVLTNWLIPSLSVLPHVATSKTKTTQMESIVLSFLCFLNKIC